MLTRNLLPFTHGNENPATKKNATDVFKQIIEANELDDSQSSHSHTGAERASGYVELLPQLNDHSSGTDPLHIGERRKQEKKENRKKHAEGWAGLPRALKVGHWSKFDENFRKNFPILNCSLVIIEQYSMSTSTQRMLLSFLASCVRDSDVS